MRTRRVRRALYKIGKLLMADDIKEDSELWKSYWDFHRKFTNHYKSQMRDRESHKLRFRGG